MVNPTLVTPSDFRRDFILSRWDVLLAASIILSTSNCSAVPPVPMHKRMLSRFGSTEKYFEKMFVKKSCNKIVN